MSELEFAVLQAAWLKDAPSPNLSQALTARRRRLWREVGRISAGGGLVLTLCILFAWFAWAQQNPLFALASVAFAAALPLFIMGFVRVRRAAMLRHNSDSLSHLQLLRDWVMLDRALLWSARGCAAILGLTTLAALTMASMGWASFATIVWPVLAWSATAIAVWTWQSGRQARLDDDLAELSRAIAEFRRTDTDLVLGSE